VSAIPALSACLGNGHRELLTVTRFFGRRQRRCALCARPTNRFATGHFTSDTVVLSARSLIPIALWVEAWSSRPAALGARRPTSSHKEVGCPPSEPRRPEQALPRLDGGHFARHVHLTADEVLEKAIARGLDPPCSWSRAARLSRRPYFPLDFFLVGLLFPVVGLTAGCLGSFFLVTTPPGTLFR
jgi:hypothetical protein